MHSLQICISLPLVITWSKHISHAVGERKHHDMPLFGITVCLNWDECFQCLSAMAGGWQRLLNEPNEVHGFAVSWVGVKTWIACCSLSRCEYRFWFHPKPLANSVSAVCTLSASVQCFTVQSAGWDRRHTANHKLHPTFRQGLTGILSKVKPLHLKCFFSAHSFR